MKLTIIGSASGMPVGKRSCSAYWLENGKDVLLLDCGDGTASAIVRANLDPMRIGAIAISHSHSDHYAGFPLLIQMLHISKRKKPLKIFVSQRIIRFLKYTLEMSYMWSERIGFDLLWQPIKNNERYDFDSFSIIPHENSHLLGYKEDLFRHPLCDLKSYSFEVMCDGIRGVYSADIGALSDIDVLLAKKAQWLLLEGMHFSLEEFEKWLASKSVEKMIITHIPPEREGKDFKNAIIAEDGMSIDIFP